MDDGIKTAHRWSWKMKMNSSPSPPSPSSPPPSTNSFCFTPTKSNHTKYLVELAHDAKRRKDPSHTAETPHEEMVELSDTKRLCYDGEPEMKLRILFSAYAELVQQHANVAEEAVLGWHEAEREADGLRKRLFLEKETMDKLMLETRVEKEVMADKIARLESQIDKELSQKISRLEKLHLDELEARVKAEAKADLLQTRLQLLEKEHEKCQLHHVLNVVKGELAQRKSKEDSKLMMDRMETEGSNGSVRDLEDDFAVKQDRPGLGCLRAHNNKCTAVDSHSEEDVMLDLFKEDDTDSSKSWAFALISQLAHIKKERGDHGSSTFAAMDGFAEMETMASLPLHQAHNLSPINPVVLVKQVENEDMEAMSNATNPKDSCQSVGTKVGETVERVNEDESVTSICREITSMMKLARTENELNLSQLENLEMKGALASVGKRLVAMLQTQCVEDDNAQHPSQQQTHLLEKIRDLLEIISKHSTSHFGGLSMESPEVRDIRWWSPSGESISEPSDIEVQYSRENHVT